MIHVQQRPAELIIEDFDLCKDLKKIGVKAKLVNSPRMQPLFNGPWTNGKVNRLSVSIDNLPPELHMIG